MALRKKKEAAGSFTSLRASLAEEMAQMSKDKAAGRSTITGRVKGERSISKWAKQNKGVDKRAARDLDSDLAAPDRQTYEQIQANLNRKARLHDKLRRGDYTGLSEAQIEQALSLVDYDNRPPDAYESDSDNIDESLAVPTLATEDDPMIRYTDEFGRDRYAKRSEVPPHLLPTGARDLGPNDGDVGVVVENPRGYFPVYEPTAERRAAIEKEAVESPLNVHYTSTSEVRARGAAHYQFSGDEETRRKQQEELRAAREETRETRQETGAVDVAPGTVEGMQEAETRPMSSAMAERKRKAEERRQQLQAKRQKKAGAPGADQDTSTRSTPIQTTRPTPPPAASVDPFAAVEADLVAAKHRPKTDTGTEAKSTVDADAWLQNFSQELSQRRKS